MNKTTNIISSIFGRFASYEFPPFLQNIINKSYVTLMRLDMSEFKSPSEYESLNALFTRAFVQPRPIDEDENIIISPADSFVTACGKNDDGLSYQIKGFSYSLKNMLKFCDEKMVDSLKDGKYINFYLSPKDYHRYHAPCDLRILKAVHIPGYLFPVNFRALNSVDNLFVKNERVILECKTKDDKNVYLVYVGALNVGQMVFTFEPRIETNSDNSHESIYEYEDLEVKKGDMMGYFKMGSTVLLIAQKDTINIENIENCKVRYGQKIARFL